MTIVWYAGNVACKAIRYFQAVITYSSTYVLVALSLDRYDAIKHPMKFSGSWQKARWLIISAWTFSAIFSVPMLFFYEEKYIQGKLQCWIDFPHLWQWKLYMSLVSTALFIIPTIIIATCYTIIVHVIRSKTIIQVSKKYEIRMDCGRWKKTVSRGLIPRAKVKTVKVTVVIVSVFIICWSPFIIFDLLQVYGFVPQTQQNIAIATFMQSLAPLNSAANPIIYCVFSTNVFKSLCKFLQRCRPMSRKESPNPTNTQSSSLTEFLTKTDTQQKRKNTLVQYKNRRTEVHL
ncbi:cardioacceleratory peptide receptor-like [Agrilus planipennis]|uniref:Cardioacceleratory peptide receptor-like n=1 Tax=Agrilus planipennis TaxID=224129 RepID=A0A1W4XGP9_AGRPL|nr:cardioacceleratory peptide receptor-like [Agrilus planipennis]